MEGRVRLFEDHINERAAYGIDDSSARTEPFSHVTVSLSGLMGDSAIVKTPVGYL